MATCPTVGLPKRLRIISGTVIEPDLRATWLSRLEIRPMATSGTMVWHNDLVFASGGFPKAETVCIRADGSGKIVWKNQQKCYEQSMIVHAGHVYAMNDGGIVFCWRATDGQEMWKHRLRGPVSASPILAAGNIYISNERGMTYVFKASPSKYTEVSGNQLGDSVFASPSICTGNSKFDGVRSVAESSSMRETGIRIVSSRG